MMLVLVNGLADAVLLPVDALLLGLREMAVVRCHVFLFAVLHTGLTLFEVRSLLRTQLVVGNAIGNSPLLVRFALIDLVYARMAGIDNSGSGARG